MSADDVRKIRDSLCRYAPRLPGHKNDVLFVGMRKIIVIVVIVLAALGIFLYLNQKPAAPTVESAQPKVFMLVIKDKKIVSGSGNITVNQGDTVTLTITNDTDEEVHLHGYNIAMDVAANKPADLTFMASSSGRFPYELEHSSTELGAISVMPK